MWGREFFAALHGFSSGMLFEAVRSLSVLSTPSHFFLPVTGVLCQALLRYIMRTASAPGCQPRKPWLRFDE